jgi:YVTN family beta-propeller protein
MDIEGRPTAIVVNPVDDRYVYYIAKSRWGIANTVEVVDTKEQKIVESIKTDGAAVAIAISSDGSRLYAAIPGNIKPNIEVIDTARYRVIRDIPVTERPVGLAVSPDGKTLVATNRADAITGLARYGDGGGVSIIDTATRMTLSTFDAGKKPTGVSIGADGTTAYIANSGSDTVSVVNLDSFRVNGTTAVGAGPVGVAASPTSKYVYVAENGSNRVSVVDTTTNQAVATIPTGPGPTAIVVGADGNKAYAAYAGNAQIPAAVAIIDTATNLPVGPPVPVGGSNPNAVAVNKDGTTLYVTYTGNKSSGAVNPSSGLSKIDIATQKITPIKVGSDPTGVVLSPDGKHAYVTSKGDNTLTIIDTTDNSTRTVRGLRGRPTALAISQDGQTLYVTCLPAQVEWFKKWPVISEIIKDADAIFRGPTISVIDAERGRVESVSKLYLDEPGKISLSPDGTVGYITDVKGALSIVDLNPDHSKIPTIASIKAGGSPTGVAITPNGSTLYITNGSGSNVWTIKNPVQTNPYPVE